MLAASRRVDRGFASWRAACVLGVAVTAVACGRGPSDFLLLDQGDSDGETDDNNCEDQRCSSELSLQRAADILFVIDNSGSMGEEQGTLAANFPLFIDVLEGERRGASYRIGITTTDVAGLRATSCRERLHEFVWEGYLGPDDEYILSDKVDEGCLNSCAFERVNLLPTASNSDGLVIPRPWIERSADTTNLPPGVGVADALQCLGPQGINGLGFEMPLESMRSVLLDRASGFVRDEALLAVIFVTDETDCSAPFDHLDRMTGPEGAALWSDPFLGPSSAVCWRAGVTCEGGPGVYSSCEPDDIGWDALPVADPEDAVLYPIDRYVETLRGIGRDKELRGGNGTTLVALINGVPLDFQQTEEIVYQDSSDPIFTLEYGIGPGCGFGTETLGDPPGMPPVRLRDFANAFAGEGSNMFPICSSDYAVALNQIAEEIAKLGARACVPGCAEDTNPYVEGLQPTCTVTDRRTEGEVDVAPCAISNFGWDFPSEQDNICYRMLSDSDGITAFEHDDLTPQCRTRGANLEFVIERRAGTETNELGLGLFVDCTLIAPRGVMCDEL